MKYINIMKYIITMKTRKIAVCVFALLCVLCAIPVQADTRTYGSGEKLYFRQYPSDWSWFGSDLGSSNHVFAYFYGSGGNAWSSEATVYKGGMLQVTVPAGTWTHVILTRQKYTTPDWGNVYEDGGKKQQTRDIPLANYAGYIHNFNQSGVDGEWWHWVSTTAAPTPSSASITCHDFDGSHTIACEKIDVCQQSIDAGDLFSLMPVWKSDKSDYNYVEPHVWLKWNATVNTWIPISDDWGEYTESLANTDHVYYYLWTGDKNTERFIHLNRVSCAVTCNITSFEYVKTPVNVNDSTFALEGSVAFTQAAGKLIISYGASKLEIATPESPQVFSLKGLKADGTTDHLIAKFEDDASCKADSIVTAPEPTSGIVEYASTDAAHYSPSRATYIHGTNVTLTPSVLVTDSFAWTDTKGAIKYSSRTGGDNHYTVSGFEHDTTLILYYTEFNDPPIVDDNMMNNGGYESTTSADDNTTTSQYVATSDYKYTGVWGGLNSKHDVYDNGYSNQNGLFGITNNANTFWKRMAHISPKEGDYLAVFDGDDDEAVAWRASTARNPHLTLQKGTTYMFSFWVANVNNYGEMVNQGNKNGAVLQFKIEYTDTNGDPHEAYLGEEIDLNDYMDNLWHQNSSTFTSDVDAETVTISVVDKNDAGISIGNDFALDDIRFRAVSIQSGTVRTRELFTVKYVEPKTEPVNLQVEWVTKPACGKDTCTLKVSFRYPNSTMHDIKLTLKDMTIGAGSYGTLVDNVKIGKTPIPGNPDSTDYVCYFTSGTFAGATSNSKILADGKKHSFKATLVVKDIKDIDHGDYTNASDLQAPAVPALEIKRCEVKAPSCSATAYSLEVDVDYTAQSGADLNYYVDDVKKATRSIGYDVELRHLNNVSFSLPADGKEHTLKVTTGHSLDCIATTKFTDPMANTISAFNVEPLQPDCDVKTYNLRATWTVTKPDGGTYDALMIKVGSATPYEIPITASNATGANAKFDIPITYTIGDAHPTIKAYMKERGATCYFMPLPTYTDPTTPRMTIGEPWFDDIACNEPTFTLIVPDTFIYQRGDIRMWLDSATYAKAKTGQKITITDGNRCAGVTTGDKYTENSKDKLVTLFKFTGLSLTGTHKIFAECTGEHSCHRILGDYAGKAFVAPVLPAAEVVFKEYGATSCSSTETSITFDLKYTNQPTGNLEMWVDDDRAAGHMITLSSPAGFTPESTLKTLSAQTISHVPADSLDTHKLHIKFTGTNGCVFDYDLPRAPFAPVINSVTISGNDAKNCGESSTYIPVITVNSSNHRNAVIAVSLDGETPQRKNASDATSFTFAARPATGGTLKVEAWFECKPDCKKTETFDVPTLPKASLTDISVTPVQADLKCDEDTVQMSFTLHYTYQDGPLTVWVDADHKAEKSYTTSEYGRLNTTEQTLNITFKNLPADGENHTLYYKFDKTGFCSGSQASIAFPRTPMITGVDPTIPPKIECVDDDYPAKFAVDFKWTADEVLVLEYKNKAGTVQYAEQSLTGKSSYTFSITMDKKDGYTQDTVYVYFKGSDFADCQHSLTHRYIFDTPSSSSVEANFEATVTDHSTCKYLLYDVSGSVSYTDADGDLIIECEGKDPIVKDEGTYSSPVSYKFEGLTAEATDKRIVAYFSNQSDCKSKSLPYSSPTVPDYIISGLKFSDPVCNDTLCDLSFTVTHTKQAGTLKYWVDGLDKKSVTVTKASEPLNLTFEGVCADSLTHVLHTQFEGSDGQLCDEERTTVTPKTPYSPLVKNISSAMTYAPCNADTYTQTVTFTVGNSQNKNVTVTCKGQTVTVASHDGENVVDIPNVPRTLSNTTDDYFEIYFPSADICNPRRKQSFTELPKPELVDITIPSDQGNIRCETAGYELIATIRYTNLNSKPNVWLDDNESAAVTLAATLKSADTLTIAVSGITVPTDGQPHELHVKADGWTSACSKTKGFDAIWRPEIRTIEHRKNKDFVYCDETYADTVIVTYKRGNGQKILVAYEDEGVPQTPVESAATAFGDGTIRIVLNGLHDATAISHAVSVYFDQVDSCAEASSFIEPTTLAITPGFTVTPDAKACDGTTYTVSGKVVANHAGESIIVKYNDSQYKTVTASTTPGTLFTIDGVDATSSGNKLTAYYVGHETCSKVNSGEFAAPVMPTIDTLHVAYSAPECNVTTTDLTFELNYTKQKGDLKLYIKGTETAYTILEGSPIVPDNDAEKTLKIKIASLTADSAKRTLRVQFTGDNSCDKSYVLPAAPFSPRITGQTATMSNIVCGSDKYTLNVTFTATNSLGRDVTIRFKGKDYVRTTADGSNTFKFENITREAVTPNNQEVQIFYADATYCTTPVTASYVETPVPDLGITIADNQGNVACDAADYVLKGTIDYTYLDQYPKVQLGSGTVYDLGSDDYKDLITLNSTTLLHFDISKLEISVPADSSAQTLKVSAEGRTEACGTISESFKTIWRPQAGTVTFDRPNMVHCDESYDLKVTVPYTRCVSGKKIYAECSDNSTLKSAYATLADDAGTAVITLSGLTETGNANHAITLYFEGRKVSCPIKSYTYQEPTRKVLSAFTVTAVGKECESDEYTVTGSIKSNIAGESVTIWYDDDHKTTVTSVVGQKAFTIPTSFNTTGNGLPIKAYFTDHNDELCSQVATTFDTPVKPVISIDNAKYGDPDCANSPTTTTLTFDLNYTMQSGTLTVWVDEDIDKHEVTYSNTTPKVEQTKTGITVSGIPADGKGHTLYVNFDGDKSCHNKSFDVGTAPFSPKVSDITAEMKEVKCGVNTYKLQIDFMVENSQGAEATIHVKGEDYKFATHDGPNTFTTPAIERETTTPNNQTIQISFASATHCKTPAEGTYVELPTTSLGITIAADQGSVDCDAENYTLQGTIDYTYIDQYPKVQLGSGTVYDLGSDEYKDLVTLNSTALQHFDISVLNISVPADSSAQTLKVSAEGRAEVCGTISELFKTIWRPQAGTVTFDRPNMVHCDEPYDLKVTVPYTRGVSGKKIYAECSDNSTLKSAYATLVDGTGTAVITLSGLTEQGNNAHELTLYFDGLKTTCPISDYTYAEPTTIAITGFTASEQPKDCDVVNYTVTGTIQTNFATDAKIIISDGFGNETEPLVASTAGTTYSLDVSGNDLTGTGNHLTATFVGHTSCTATSDDFDEPVKPTAKVESVTPKQPDCDVTTYELDFKISYTFQPGKVTVWVDDHKAETEFDIKVDQTSSNTLTGTLSGDELVADGSTGHVLHFQFAGDHACDGSQTGTFTAPRTPLITDIEITNVPKIVNCVTTSYTPSVKVSYEKAAGETITLEYQKANSTWETVTSTPVSGDDSYTFNTLTFDDIAMGMRTVHAYFTGSDCKTEGKHTKTYHSPSNSSINPDYDVVVENISTCGQLQYNLSGSVTYEGAKDGDLIVMFDADHTFTILEADCQENTPLDFHFDNLNVAIPEEGKTLYAYFDNQPGCKSLSKTIFEPATPTLVIANPAYDEPDCNVTTTTLTFDVTYIRQQGTLHASLGTTEQTYSIQAGATPTFSDAEQTVTLAIAGLAADQSVRTLRVWFDGERSCDETITLSAAPFSPKVLTTKAKMKDVACDKDTYTLEVTFTVENSQNKPATLVFPRGSSTPVEVSTTDGTTYTYSFTNVTRTFGDATDDYVELSFADAAYCTTPTRIEYTETAKPEASVVNVKANQPDCDVTTFTLDFKLSYTYQHGNVTVWVDDHKSEQIFTIPEDSIGQSTAKTLTDTLSGADLVADGSTGHVLHFQFAGDNACDGQSAAFDFPQTPLITSTDIDNANIPQVVPGVDKPYDVTITVTYELAIGERIVLEYFDKNDQAQHAYSPEVTGNDSYEFHLTFNDVAVTGERVVNAYFEGSDCKTGGTHTDTYTAPSNSSAKFELLDLINTSSCDALLYDLTGTVSFVGAAVGDLVVEFDADHKYTIPEADCVAGENIPFAIRGVDVSIPAEGKQLKVYFSELSNNKSYSEEVYQPVIPTMAISTAAYSTPACNSTTTTLMFDLTYLKQQGNLHVAVDGVEQAYTLSDDLKLDDKITQSLTVTVADQPADMEERQLTVWFDGDKSCSRTLDLPQAPFGPQIIGGEAVASNFICGSDVYDVAVSVTTANHLGKDLTLICHDQTKVVPVTGSPMSVHFTAINRTIDNTSDDFIELYFADASNATDCVTEHIKITYVEPAKPALNADVKVDTVFTCGSKQYDFTVTISSENQPGACYVLDSIAGGVVRTVATHEGAYNGTDEFYIALPATNEQHFVVVRYPATSCEEISSVIDINTYTKPKPLISLTAIDRLCNNETELQLSLVITQGDIDEATLTLTNSKGETVISAADMDINATHDTLSYSLSSQLTAGKYTATIEARDTLDCETSATQAVEFAIDGVVFSKWTDVLLVDNADGLFTGYQWYENDKLLDGQTAQVLYMPEKDMTGNSYYCRLQTADGDIYTCERVFGGDLPRSADNPKPQTTNHITVLPSRVAVNDAVTVRQSANENLHLILMSATGKRVAEYTQQEAAKLVSMPGVQGIYLLRIEAESEVQTVKIVVY